MTFQLTRSKILRRSLRCLVPMLCLTARLMPQEANEAKTSPSTVRAKAVLGVEGIPNNADGSLSVNGDAVVFQSSRGPALRIPIASIRNIALSEEDKQVGGTPMAVGRSVTPFGGGRAIGLLAHKKYDFLTCEYIDSDGGFHGAVWQLDRTQAQPVGRELKSRGVDVSGLNEETTSGQQKVKNEAK